MEKTARIFRSFEEAEKADAAADMKLTPAQRVQIVIDLHGQVYPDAAEQRFERVFKIIKLEQS